MTPTDYLISAHAHTSTITALEIQSCAIYNKGWRQPIRASLDGHSTPVHGCNNGTKGAYYWIKIDSIIIDSFFDSKLNHFHKWKSKLKIGH